MSYVQAAAAVTAAAGALAGAELEANFGAPAPH
jgi:hypothetical protein